jgi:hypothetical protein
VTASASAVVAVVVVVSASVAPGLRRWRVVTLPRAALAVDDAVVPVELS